MERHANVMAVGFDNIDVPEITHRKIPGGNTPGVLTDTTADLAWALLMSAARRIIPCFLKTERIWTPKWGE